MQSIKIRYVGKKPFAVDNVAGSRKVWQGKDDIQEVTPAQAKTLLKYPDQWALVEKADESKLVDAGIQVHDADGDLFTVETEALNKPIEKMTKPELIAFAKAKLGKKLDGRKSTKDMIDQIEEWIAETGADVRA